jgi:hypothetical protein
MQAPSAIAAAAKTGSDEEMYKTIDELVEKLDKGATLVRADLDAVEQWLAIAEAHPTPAARATPPSTALRVLPPPSNDTAPVAPPVQPPAGSAAPAATP